MAFIKSYRDLIVWQKAMQLVEEIYKLTDKFPRSEMFVLTAQMKRCSISIPSNIAEGRKWSSFREFRRFLTIAYGSGTELETQIEIAKRLNYVKKEDCLKVDSLLNEVMKILNKLLSTLKS